jgi:PelA/Pel-15E family pectate lyase
MIMPLLRAIAQRLPAAQSLALCFLLGAIPLHAADDSLAKEARATMEKATTYMRSIAAEGGYLWRYSPDLKERAGENVATPTQIWVQPPGTPSMGMAFLGAYEATGDARYLDAAKAAANALAVGQLESGGWDYVVDFDPKFSVNWYRRTDKGKVSEAEAAKRKNVSTFDDDNTQSAIRLLLAVADASKGSNEPRDVRIREARDHALTKLLEAQRPNGGWPQRWTGVRVDPKEYPVQPASFPKSYPREHPKPNYNGYYTLNDNTHRDCIATLLDAAKRLGRPEYRAAALKGGDFLLLAQLPEPQPAWAQQYNPQLQPDWARAFEPPSVCSNESGGAMRILVDLYLETGNEKYLEPMPRAIAWFKRSEISPNNWARMYEIGTNTPIYGDRDGIIKYRVEDLSPERQTGYSWKGAYGLPAVFSYYEEVKSSGRAAILEKRKQAEASAKSAKSKAARAKAIEPRVREIIAALDGQGRWLGSGGRKASGPQITTGTFIMNLRTLSEYVEAVK